MSYILQALKDAQRSREGRQVPDLQTVHAVPAPGEGPPRSLANFKPLLLLAGILIAVLGGWWVAGLQHDGPIATVDTLEPSTPKAVAPESPISIGQAENAGADVGQEELVITPGEEVPPRLEEQLAPELEISDNRVEVTPDIPVGEQGLVPEVSEPDTSLTAAHVPAPSTLPPESSKIKDEVDQPPEVPTPLEEQVPHFRNMPPEIQEQVSLLAFTIHRYSPNPDLRMVKINGLIWHEGDEVLPGMVVEKIIPGQVVLTYQAYLFRVPVR
ncbi:MAG: general secretion pathway protein GspB [Halioglobus sp.]